MIRSATGGPSTFSILDEFAPEDFRVLHITRSIWHGREQDPKTPAAIREVDIAEPLAEMLRAFAEGKDGYLFSTRSGPPLGHRNVNRRLESASTGFDAFASKHYAGQILKT
jgi:hypothetical protein